MTPPLVSVAMITYNHAPYIAQAIEGVLQQKTDFPFELVIGEDCSTDGTREIVMDYQRRYPEIIRVVTSESNVGAHANAIRTEQACRGKYIAYCEGDDYWHRPDKLQIQVAYLETHPECGMVHSDADIYNMETGRIIRNASTLRNRSRAVKGDTFVNIMLGKWPIIFTCTVLVRTTLLLKVVGENSYEMTAFLMRDKPIWLEMSRVTAFGYIPESLGTYRVCPESASHSKDVSKRIRFAKSCLAYCLHYLGKYDAPANVRRTCLRKQYEGLLGLAFRARDAALAKEALQGLRASGNRVGLRAYVIYLGANNALLADLLSPFRCIRRRLIRFIYNIASERHIGHVQ